MPRQIDISKLIAGAFVVLPLIVIGLALNKYAAVGVEGYLIVAGGVFISWHRSILDEVLQRIRDNAERDRENARRDGTRQITESNREDQC